MRVASVLACMLIALAGTAVHAQSTPAKPKPAIAPRGDAGAAFALGLCFDAPWYSDPGYDVFGDNDAAARLGLWVAYDVAALRKDAFVAAELGWGHESEKGKVLGLADTKLSTQVVYVGATMRWVPLTWLQPHLRVAAGAAFVDAELTEGKTHLRDRGSTSPYAGIGVGFTLRTATRTFENQRGKLASLSLGVMVEGGYTLAKSIDLHLDAASSEPSSGMDGITLSEPALGELERSGPYLRVSLVGRI